MDQSVRLMEANGGYGGSSFTARQRKRMVVCDRRGGPHLKAVEFSHTDERPENIRFEVGSTPHVAGFVSGGSSVVGWSELTELSSEFPN